jgi:hypothetical protein
VKKAPASSTNPHMKYTMMENSKICAAEKARSTTICAIHSAEGR